MPQTWAVDVWQLGTILYQILLGNTVWSNHDSDTARDLVAGGMLPQIDDTMRNSSDPVHGTLRGVLDMCFVYGPSEKASARLGAKPAAKASGLAEKATKAAAIKGANSSLNALIACRLLLGVAEAAILTIVNTLIADYWDDRGRKDWLFLQGICGPFFASGVILLSGAASSVRWNGIFMVYAVAFPIFIAMLLWLFEPRRADGATIADIAQSEKAPRTPFPTASVALIGGVTLVASALYYVFIISGSLAWREVGVMDPARIGQLTAIPSLFVMLGALIFRLMGNRPQTVQLATFFGLLGIGLAGIGLAPDWRWLVAALIVQQTGAGMAVPTIISWAQSKLPFEHRGRGMGVWTACFFFGQFSSPWAVHQAENLVGTMQGAFLAAGLVGVIAAIVIGLVRAPRTPTPTIAPAE